MIVLVIALGVVVAVFATCIAPNLGRRSRPAEDRTEAIAAASQRIVKLHREIGIDPIYDPVPAPPIPAPPKYPLHVRVCCYGCDWRMGGDHFITLAAFINHVEAKHPERPPSVVAALRRALAEQQRQAEQESDR